MEMAPGLLEIGTIDVGPDGRDVEGDPRFVLGDADIVDVEGRRMRAASAPQVRKITVPPSAEEYEMRPPFIAYSVGRACRRMRSRRGSTGATARFTRLRTVS
jgi:hypothetical protein